MTEFSFKAEYLFSSGIGIRDKGRDIFQAI